MTPKPRKRKAAAILGVVAAFFCVMIGPSAWAGAWPLKDGEGLAILKYEDQKADTGFNPDGLEVPIDPRVDETLSLYTEYGLRGRLTLQTKVALTRGHDNFIDYQGLGPIEIGLRYAVLHTDRSAISLYLGATKDGVGRNAGYAAPGQATWTWKRAFWPEHRDSGAGRRALPRCKSRASSAAAWRMRRGSM